MIVAALVTVVLVVALVPGVLAGEMGMAARSVCAAGVAVFGLLFVTVAARIVGIVGVSSQPTSGITLVTLLGTASLFAAFGWVEPGARAAVLTVGTIVAVAASKAGDISQDLKTGFLVGATPARQQLGQLIGAACACWAVAATVMLLSSYGFGSKELPAPQATLMKTIIEGVLSGELPWGLVLTGAGVSGAAMLCGVSGLAFAIGMYLPLATMAPIFVGGCVRAMASRGAAPASARSEALGRHPRRLGPRRGRRPRGRAGRRPRRRGRARQVEPAAALRGVRLARRRPRRRRRVRLPRPRRAGRAARRPSAAELLATISPLR